MPDRDNNAFDGRSPTGPTAQARPLTQQDAKIRHGAHSGEEASYNTHAGGKGGFGKENGASAGRGNMRRAGTTVSLQWAFRAVAFTIVGVAAFSAFISLTHPNGPLGSGRLVSSELEETPHVAIVYDRFPGEFEGNDEYSLMLMSVMREWRWKVTLITLLQGQRLQTDQFSKIRNLGVQVIMISSATVITSRGELGAALSTMPPVDMFFLIQTLRNKQSITPMAILRPFVVNANAVYFSADTHALRDKLIGMARDSLDKGQPLMNFNYKNISWIPRAASAHTLDHNEVLEQYGMEKKSISLADKLYLTSDEDVENFAEIVCDQRDGCDKELHKGKMSVLNFGNPQPVVSKVGPFSSRNRIIFIGGESEVNRLNLRFFIERVLPKIRGPRPEVIVDVFIPDCAEQPGISCRNWRGSTQEAFDASILMVYPSLAGTGMHLKNWMALSRGVPVVTTSFGATGFRPSECGMVVANSADLFAMECLRLMGDEHHWNELSQAALRCATEGKSEEAKQSLLGMNEMTFFSRDQQAQSIINEAELVTLKAGRPVINVPALDFHTTAVPGSLGPRPEIKSSEGQIRLTKCDTKPTTVWSSFNDKLHFLFIYIRSPAQFMHYDREVFQMVQLLTGLNYAVTFLTLYPTEKAQITNEAGLRNLGVHFVHMNDARDEKAVREELSILRECLKFNVIVTSPEYSLGHRQEFHKNVDKVIEELPELKDLPRILFMFTVYTLQYTYDRRVKAEIFERSQNKTSPELLLEFDENAIMASAKPEIDRMYLYERNLAKKSDYIVMAADLVRDKARSLWCGPYYEAHVQEKEDGCFMDSKTRVMHPWVTTAEIWDELMVAPPEERKRLIFVGTKSARNTHAALWYMAEVLPLVRKELPDADVTVVGTICHVLQTPEMKARYPVIESIHCTIPPNDAAFTQVLGESRVYANPMVSGMESNGRLLGPFKASIPVVATPLGAIGFEEGPHIRIAKSAQEFADSVVLLMRDSQAWRTQSEAARKWIKENRNFQGVLSEWQTEIVPELTNRVSALPPIVRSV